MYICKLRLGRKPVLTVFAEIFCVLYIILRAAKVLLYVWLRNTLSSVMNFLSIMSFSLNVDTKLVSAFIRSIIYEIVITCNKSHFQKSYQSFTFL